MRSMKLRKSPLQYQKPYELKLIPIFAPSYYLLHVAIKITTLVPLTNCKNGEHHPQTACHVEVPADPNPRFRFLISFVF